MMLQIQMKMMSTSEGRAQGGWEKDDVLAITPLEEEFLLTCFVKEMKLMEIS